MSIQDPLFICERTALDKLVAGLLDPCIYKVGGLFIQTGKILPYIVLFEPLPPPKDMNIFTNFYHFT